jgi:hypothetical protein
VTWLALRALVARVPSIVWVILLALALIAGGLSFTYCAGVREGKVTAHRIALQDSATKAHDLVRVHTAESDRRSDAATKQAARSDAGRLARRPVRAEVEPLLAGLPDPVVRLIAADDAQIFRDSITIAAHVVALDAARVERDARIAADTVEAHQIALPPGSPRKSPRMMYAVGGAVVGALAVLTLLAAR